MYSKDLQRQCVYARDVVTPFALDPDKAPMLHNGFIHCLTSWLQHSYLYHHGTGSQQFTRNVRMIDDDGENRQFVDNFTAILRGNRNFIFTIGESTNDDTQARVHGGRVIYDMSDTPVIAPTGWVPEYNAEPKRKDYTRRSELDVVTEVERAWTNPPGYYGPSITLWE